MVNKDRLVGEFMQLVEIDSESGHEGRLRDDLLKKLDSLGLSVYEDKAGQLLKGESGNIIAKLGGTLDKPPILFCAHMDTVKPGIGIRAFIRGDIIYSQGDTVLGADDKAGIAVILESLRVIQEAGIPHPPLEVVFTVREEQGLLGAKNLDFSRISSSMAFVLDSAGEPGTIITRSPRQNEIEFRVRGRAAHAGINPEDGINAIHVAAQALAGMRMGRIDEETTCNLGTIEGGKARNIVADFCRIGGEARSLSPVKLQHITNEMVEHFRTEVEKCGAACEVKVECLYPEIDLQPDEPAVLLACRAVRNLGQEPQLLKTGGGSDASIFNSRGIQCVNLGIGMQAVHTTDEHIYVRDLVDMARLVTEIIKEAGK